MKQKCTYEDCFRHFETREAMIKHKKKDPEHAYCGMCDVDCQDDLDLMIHQIESPKHICCPVCGMEFKTIGGRDRHVETSHAAAQTIVCRGCKSIFSRASHLMRHIETNQCKVISSKDFQQERAERAVEKDAMEQHLNAMEGSFIHQSAVTSNSQDSEVNAVGGVSLIDGRQPGVQPDQENQPIAIQPTSTNSYRAPLPPPTGPFISALDKYPELPRQPKKTTAASTAPNSDLLNLQEAEQRIGNLSIQGSVWGKQSNHSKTLFPSAGGNPFPTEDTDNRYDQLTEISFRTDGTRREPILPAPRTRSTTSENLPPPCGLATINDPNFPNQHVSTKIQVTRDGTIDLHKFYDPVREAYECPGLKCLRLFPTPAAFRDHLISGAHVTGYVTCPSCLNRFATNTALISHMEASGRGCNIRNSTNYNQILREVSAGLLGTSGHLETGEAKYTAPVDEGWDFPEERR